MIEFRVDQYDEPCAAYGFAESGDAEDVRDELMAADAWDVSSNTLSPQDPLTADDAQGKIARALAAMAWMAAYGRSSGVCTHPAHLFEAAAEVATRGGEEFYWAYDAARGCYISEFTGLPSVLEWARTMRRFSFAGPQVVFYHWDGWVLKEVMITETEVQWIISRS